MKVGQMGTGQLGIDRFGGAVPTVQAVVDLDAVRVAKRDPADGMVPYDRQRIRNAIMKAFLAEQRSLQGEALDHRVDPIVDAVEQRVAQRALGRPSLSVAVEEIQDQVELVLMKSDHEEVARRYIIYREDRARDRAAQAETTSLLLPVELMVALPDGTREPLDLERLKVQIEEACHGLDGVSADDVLEVLARDVYNDITPMDLRTAQIMAARSLVEQEPDYSKVSARLVLRKLKDEVFPFICPDVAGIRELTDRQQYRAYFPRYVRTGIDCELLQPALAEIFDLERLAEALAPERDQQFQFLGLQTLYDRYFLHSGGTRIELPQAFFMRVAMGLAQREAEPDARAIEFYELLSSFDFMCSTPTLFNSGTVNPQLSSCFLSTVPDDLAGIFKAIKDNALLSKFSGGLGNDWSQVRGLGAHIKGTNGESQGVIPFLKVANDTAVAVNQGGRRKGAVCAYLEVWHIDIDEFLDLRKNTGDDRRRTHDMNTACWVPDLFMERVQEDGNWTLFSPDGVPDLHEVTGLEFRDRYLLYEQQAAEGRLKVTKRIRARDLWRRMLTMLYETGHPWITFKDPCNLRSPQQHVGVVHSSNLCTEITLNSSEDEVAVCNLGSVNLSNHVENGQLLHQKLERTVTTAMRMLDNVIDINYYTIPETQTSNRRHRPVGMGIMGFQDVLHKLNIAYASDEAVEFADISMEAVSWYAISASSALAEERGSYSSFEGSLWSQGRLPWHSLDDLDKARYRKLEVDRSATRDWDSLARRVQRTGMRNSNVMAIAPTATIANICGVSPSIEPVFRNLYVKANMSGDFVVVNPYLVDDLKELDLWDPLMISDLKLHDGSLRDIPRVPDRLKDLYATAFEIDPTWLVKAGARRQKWIDQSQSLNLYVSTTSGRELDELYQLAWTQGLKTTYYLRTQGATQVEKSTLQGTDGRLNAVPVAPAPPTLYSEIETTVDGLVCDLDDEDCEACQ